MKEGWKVPAVYHPAPPAMLAEPSTRRNIGAIMVQLRAKERRLPFTRYQKWQWSSRDRSSLSGVLDGTRCLIRKASIREHRQLIIREGTISRYVCDNFIVIEYSSPSNFDSWRNNFLTGLGLRSADKEMTRPWLVWICTLTRPIIDIYIKDSRLTTRARGIRDRGLRELLSWKWKKKLARLVMISRIIV